MVETEREIDSQDPSAQANRQHTNTARKTTAFDRQEPVYGTRWTSKLHVMWEAPTAVFITPTKPTTTAAAEAVAAAPAQKHTAGEVQKHRKERTRMTDFDMLSPLLH